MSNFRSVDRGTAYLLPPSVEEWLPADHLARFVVEIVEQLDLTRLSGQYRGSGSQAYHPGMLVALLIYGYATGTYSSRRIEQACYDSIAFRYIAANTHPDHDTLCAFRRPREHRGTGRHRERSVAPSPARSAPFRSG